MLGINADTHSLEKKPGACDAGLPSGRLRQRPEARALPAALPAGWGASKIFRIEPRQNELQELDPRSLDIRSIVRTEIPDQDTKGLVDEITVKISPQEAHWEVKRYRPQIEWEINSINLSSLTYRGEFGSFDDPEPDQVITTGTCPSLDPPTT
ncbi:hypothetical protein [Synechococcus sp. CS-1328]|uniref:hypothetical protein n=1 Tax=Synechococcus sp. CS-1328 TaxID=2847976 RepID=UPI00223B8A6A|nr:hypothetical protein [Synechococcus sp. CS-1328]MCT0225473.1 hypothetical protein [Synechococcus sp. CS-1328]